MKTFSNPLLAGFLCFASCLAFGNTIPITGTAYDGFATTEGDFTIMGPGLNLYQALPDGPSFIGSCAVGAMCSLSFTIPSSAAFCEYCTNFSFGSLGDKTADFLDPNLTVSGSALYTGGSTLMMPMTVSGTVTGYQLNCNSLGCTLGQKEFTVRITGQGTGTLSMNTGSNINLIYGVSVNFSGIASATPEPVSLVLTGTGLVGVWISKKKMARAKQA